MNIAVQSTPGGKGVNNYSTIPQVTNRGTEIKHSAYVAMDIYIKVLTICGLIFIGITVLLFLSICMALLASTSDGLGQLLGMGSAFVTFPIVVATGLLAFSCFFTRDLLKMRMDDSRNIVIIAQCMNDVVQQQAAIAHILEKRK